MSQSNSNRTWQFIRTATVVVAIGLLAYAIVKRSTPARKDISAVAANGGNVKTGHPTAIFKDYQPPSTNAPEPVLNLKPEAVLASVNGRSLKAQDVLPPGSSNQPVSLEVCEYFLQRAIDRELVFQTARSQGVELDPSQKQQMENFKTMREQRGPGLVSDLNGGAPELSFESRDAEAFMLQASLMEKSGASPNVTAEQVNAYYQQHLPDFGELPADEQARHDAWNNIDFQIREKLASGVRSDFQNRLADYMKQLEAKADIQRTPLTSFAGVP